MLVIDSSKKISEAEKNEMMAQTKTLRKLNISVDVVLIGIMSSEKEFLQKFVEQCAGSDDLW